MQMSRLHEQKLRSQKPTTIHGFAQSGDLPGVQRLLRENPSLLNDRNPVLENVVRLLLELEPESDPVWHYLNLQSSQVSLDTSVNTSLNQSDQKVGDGKYFAHSLDEVAELICSTMSAYESKVLNAFNDLEESNILQPYMSNAIKEISRACQAFEAKESAPPVAVAALRTLQSEITKSYILRLCSWMRASIEEISRDETWVPVSFLERNKSPYTISSLPLAFHSIMFSAMDQINLKN